MTGIYEDKVLSEIFACTLDSSRANNAANPPIVHLHSLAEELREEQTTGPASESESPPALLLNQDILERLLMARLSDPPASYPQLPLVYLLECYRRASAAVRSVIPLKDKEAAERLRGNFIYCKELVVNYTGLLLTLDMFPQPVGAPPLPEQLLDVLGMKRASSIPPGFLDEFAAKIEEEGLEELLNPVVHGLLANLAGMSAMGAYHCPMDVLNLLISCKPVARTLVKLPVWLPAITSGRSLPTSSLLGPAFSVSVLPDSVGKPQPDVRVQYFSNIDSRSQPEISATLHSMQVTSNQIAGSLHAMVKTLLSKDTREPMVTWLASVLESNAERAKTMVDPKIAAPDGFIANVTSVLLSLCTPFLDPSSDLAFRRIDARYITQNSRISFKDETTFGLLSPNDLLAGAAGAGSQPAPEFSFICEVFFMTAKALHLGFVHMIEDHKVAGRSMGDHQSYVRDMQAMLDGIPNQNSMEAMQGQRQLALVKTMLETAKGNYYQRISYLQDPAVLTNVLAFYKLMAAWLMRLASPSTAGIVGAMPELPLPSPVPFTFSSLPEYFLEDMADVLLWVADVMPDMMGGSNTEDFLMFLIVFLGSADYIKNPFLRAKLVEVLHAWIPADATHPELGPQPQSAAASNIKYVMEGHPVVQQHMVRSLLTLFVDIEHTDRSNTFYEKFNTRYRAGLILGYLWSLPAHREAWRALAAEDGCRGLYLRFVDVIYNDVLHLLDGTLKILPAVRELEDLMADTERLRALPRAEQRERTSTLQQQSSELRSNLQLAAVYVRLVQLSTEDITKPWLLPEMVTRVADMLTYFLDHLAGPKRKQLRVRKPDKYRWKPQELLKQLALIYLNLGRADVAGDFVAAIAADKRSYHEGLFVEAAEVLRRLALLQDHEADELEALGERVALAAQAGEMADAEMGEIPDEFTDPITYGIMEDPVVLPSGLSVDRASIMRHLLSNSTDPFSRQTLTVDMLKSDVVLRDRIQAWKAEQRLVKR